MHGPANRAGLSHVPARPRSIPSDEVAGRIGIETVISIGLVLRLLVQFAVELAVVVHSVKRQKSCWVKHGLVAAQVGGHLPAPPPNLELAGGYTGNAGLGKVLVIELIKPIFQNFNLEVLLTWHNPLVAYRPRLCPYHGPVQQQAGQDQ